MLKQALKIKAKPNQDAHRYNFGEFCLNCARHRSPTDGPRCSLCLSAAEPDLRRCADCLAVVYCSRACQRANRANHRGFCHIATWLLKYDNKISSTLARLLACQAWCERHISPLACAPAGRPPPPPAAEGSPDNVVLVIRLDADATHDFRLLDARYCSPKEVSALLDTVYRGSSASMEGVPTERSKVEAKMEQREGVISVLMVDVGSSYPFRVCVAHWVLGAETDALRMDWVEPLRTFQNLVEDMKSRTRDLTLSIP
ncbi:hypothetical protein BV25DRAFT_1916472 [Artomyces pyxidatus]|uniref:Uncharacterized protein n=1 Tax=Artomyces pyxidatus TaxID=48021 RepID=A0ACB8T027_9AGAM|nr:hypothetical protein BV25DRAFT_1916472 [Artomyces pyxidatus]